MLFTLGTNFTIELLLLLGILINCIFAVPLINFLYKYKFYKIKKSEKVDTTGRNPKYYDFLLQNMDTPSSFGILLLIDLVTYQLFIGKPQSISIVVLLIYFGFLGLADDIVKYFYYEKIKRWGLSIIQKVILQILGVAFFLYFLNLSPIWLLLATLYIIFITNSVNITDGLDGLVATLGIYILPVLVYFEISTLNNLIIVDIATITFSFLLVFLYFNIKPARVFLGDAGSMPLGIIFGIMSIRYGPLPVAILLSLIAFEGFSSLIQMFSIRFFGKKVFAIAPFHLHLLNRGWADTKVVQRFGLIQILLCILSIVVFNFLK